MCHCHMHAGSQVCVIYAFGFNLAGITNATFTDKLRVSLSLIKQWQDVPGKAAAQDTAIGDFISRSIESGDSLESIKEQLQKFYSEDLLISNDVYDKAQQLATDEYAKSNPTASEVLINPLESAAKSRKIEPLFCKDTIYHASVCSQAVSTCNAGDYQKFFKNKELVPGHAFKAVSFSRSKNESFLVALKGESTYYFAFKGRLSLSDWSKDYKSFNEGILPLS